MKGNPITLKDIAKQLGITVATVSRALKNYPDISPQTKEAVLDLAKKLNYRPNPIALNLRKNRSNIIGVIVPELVHHFFSTVISGIMEAADEAGYTVMLFQSNESFEKEVKEAGVLLASRVDGLLISLANETKSFEHLEEFIEYNIPVVLFDKITDNLAVSKVIVDDFEGAFHAVEHLIQQGCRRIAHIRGPLGPSNSHLRFNGYVAALEKYQIPFAEELVFQCEKVTHEEGIEFVKQMLAMPQKPDGIFAVADQVAIGAATALKNNGIKIPDEMAVVGFSDWLMTSIVEPPISTVAQPGFEMGRTAVKRLLEEIDLVSKDQVINPHTEILKTTLLVRQSSLKKG
jgi:LacI family transcriptional regulator